MIEALITMNRLAFVKDKSIPAILISGPNFIDTKLLHWITCHKNLIFIIPLFASCWPF